MGFLAQHAALLQRLAIAPGATGFFVELHRDHQAAAAHLFDDIAAQALQGRHEARAHFLSVLNHAFLNQHLERRPGDGTSQRIAAECAAMLAGLQHAQHLRIGKHRRHRIEAA